MTYMLLLNCALKLVEEIILYPEMFAKTNTLHHSTADNGGMGWRSRCATSRMVTGSIPGGVTGFFSDILPSDRTMALGVDSAPSENEYQEHSWG